jgi:endonuclease YncB( thermonuclease family)
MAVLRPGLRIRRPRPVVLVLAAVLAVAPLLTGAVPAAAQLATARCLEDGTGPACLTWTGTVTAVSDGDTLDVRLDDGTTQRVRVNGLQATELTTYSRTPARRRGECHALEATARLEQLAPVGGRVRLSAQSEASRSGTRARRSVFVLRDGAWRDVARTMLQEGHALWLPASDEPAHNVEYDLLAQQARAAHVGLWDDDSCGAGPSPGAALRIWATWDANGVDGVDLNGEFVQVKNAGTRPVLLAGWWLRESGYRGSLARGFVFPAGASVPAGGSITVFVGSGRPTATRFYWGQTSPVFENVDSRTGRADGAYLFDPQGDLRASMTYPCRVACADPLAGRIALTAVYDPPRADTAATEEVVVTNTSRTRVGLEGYQLWSWPYGYTFPPGTSLRPSESLRVRLGTGRTTPLMHYWGLRLPALGNGGDSVALRSSVNVTVACRYWGSTRGCRTSD